MWYLLVEALSRVVFFLGYFGNSGGFPKALSKKEEE